MSIAYSNFRSSFFPALTVALKFTLTALSGLSMSAILTNNDTDCALMSSDELRLQNIIFLNRFSIIYLKSEITTVIPLVSVW